jgi:phosphate transport system permease protein
VVTETYSFFGQYDWRDFFFSTTWSPNFRGGSDLGIIPLIWDTLYIQFIALVLAVPVGFSPLCICRNTHITFACDQCT